MKNRLFLEVATSIMTVSILGNTFANTNINAEALDNSLNTYLCDNYSSNSENSTLTLKDTLVEGIKNFETIVDISQYHILNVQELQDTFTQILFDCPQFFYLSSKYSYYYDMDNSIFAVKLNYTTDKNGYLEQKNVIDKKFSEIVNEIDDTRSSYEKALLVHDYLCDNFDYDYTYSNYTLMDFIENKTGVCQAYTLAYNYILNELGIKSYSVQSDSINHMWNMVELNGKYYHVDVTWDDCMTGLLGHFDHNNFLITDNTINETHCTDWSVFDNISATDDTFENYSFTSSMSSYILTDYGIYCFDNNNLCVYDLSNDYLGVVNNLLDGFTWHDLTSNDGAYYSESYVCLVKYKDIFFYNTPNSIVITNHIGKILDTVYNHNDSTSEIYGIAIQDGNLVAQFESNLDFSRDDFGTNIVDICNVEEFYKERIAPRTDIYDDNNDNNHKLRTAMSVVNGDINEDGQLDSMDLFIMNKCILQNFEYISQCDLNNDNVINVLDILTLKSYLFK